MLITSITAAAMRGPRVLPARAGRCGLRGHLHLRTGRGRRVIFAFGVQSRRERQDLPADSRPRLRQQRSHMKTAAEWRAFSSRPKSVSQSMRLLPASGASDRAVMALVGPQFGSSGTSADSSCRPSMNSYPPCHEVSGRLGDRFRTEVGSAAASCEAALPSKIRYGWTNWSMNLVGVGSSIP
jgi:hypothetical protein